MRQRITYIHKPEDHVDPSKLYIDDYSIQGIQFAALREDRITFALEELLQDFQNVFQGAQELHMRWVSPTAYTSFDPLSSRMPPGLHIFYTPAQADRPDLNGLCASLRRFIGDKVNCAGPESFIKLPKHRFSSNTAYQFWDKPHALSDLLRIVRDTSCPGSGHQCPLRVGMIDWAKSIDVSYEAIAHTIKINVQWTHQTTTLNFQNPIKKHRTEVGILTQDKPPTLGQHELGLTGLLTVLGQDKKPQATMFSFASRHRQYPGTFTAKFLEPTGLHPTLQLDVSSARPPRGERDCQLNAYFTLPKGIFPDKYQLADNLFLASKNLTSLRFVTDPIDLEAPAYTTPQWGSGMMLQLKPPASSRREDHWTAEVPLHLRYQKPNDMGYTHFDVPYPALFWACSAEEGTKFSSSPFDRTHLGYDSLFGPRTVFWHVEPLSTNGNTLMNEVRVPVIDEKKTVAVGYGTSWVVVLGFAFVVLMLIRVLRRSGYRKEAFDFDAKTGKAKKN